MGRFIHAGSAFSKEKWNSIAKKLRILELEYNSVK